MAKIRITSKDYITITQAPHGRSQNFKALDIAPDPLICPASGSKLTRIYRDYEQSFFELTLPDGSVIQATHGHPTGQLGRTYNRGDIIGYSYFGPYRSSYNSSNLGQPYPSHWHIAIRVRGVWDYILNYVDRTVDLRLGYGFSSTHWANWSTWPDKQLNLILTRPIPMDKYLLLKTYFIEKVLKPNKYPKIFTEPTSHIKYLRTHTLQEWMNVWLPAVNRRISDADRKYNLLLQDYKDYVRTHPGVTVDFNTQGEPVESEMVR